MTSKNSFLLEYPRLEKQWCFEKNEHLNPYTITSGSEKRAYWICKKGHIWDAPISKRTKRGQGCPYCSNHRVSMDNCLATMNPALAKEWNYHKNKELTPEMVTVGSGKKVWWRCSHNHEWEATIRNRNNGAGCHYCTRQKTSKEKSISKLVPKLLNEWNYIKNIGLNPEEIPLKSTKMVWWKCKNGHEWKERVLNRTRFENNSCPVCQSLEFVRPDIASEWNYNKNTISPKEVKAGSHISVWWKCENEHEWEERVDFRTSKQNVKCPMCESFEYNHPELLEEWDYEKNELNPKDVKPGSHKKVWWKCKYNHEWEARVSYRAVRSQGCPTCNSQTSFPEQYISCFFAKYFADTENRRKIQGIELDVYIPSLSLGIEYDGVRWHKDKCEKDIEKDEFFRSQGIYIIRIREKGLEELQTSKAFIITERPSTQDLQVVCYKVLNYINKVYFENKRNFEKEEIFYHEVLKYITYLQKEKNLENTHPHLVKEWDFEKNERLKPSHFTYGSGVEVWWKCEEGHSWKKRISKRSAGESCPYCCGKRADDTNNLLLKFPDIAKEWNKEKNEELKPNGVTPGSGKKVWWKCGQNHEWEAVVSSRTKKGNGCPYCAGKRASKQYNLKTLYSELSTEWHQNKNGELLPEHVTPGSRLKVWWKCSQNHEWEASITHRTKSKTGCPYCSGRKSTKERSLATQRPHLVKEWHFEKNKDLTPDDVSVFSGKRVWWRCTQNHEWEAAINNRSYGRNCPECYKESRKK